MKPIELDSITRAFFLDVPGPKVVLLQGYFETYEGVGTVRTLDIKNSLLAIVTTKDLQQECLNILESIKEEVNWRFVTDVDEDTKNRFVGFWTKEL